MSCLGNDRETVSTSLRELRSGIREIPAYAEHGLRCHVAGVPDIDLEALIDRKLKRFMGNAAAYSYVAMRDAIADAGLSQEDVQDARTGVIAGSGGGSPEWQVETADLLRNKGVRRVGPYMVPRTMCSTVSATLATWQRKPCSAYAGTSRIPERSSRSDVVTVSRSLPRHDTMPSPVTTTRRT